MPTRTISPSGGNYNDINAWVELQVPTSSDDIVCLPAGASGQLTVNVASLAKTVNFTNYTNTLTMNNSLTVSGDFALASGMTISGSSGLIINSNANLTSNGVRWPNNLNFSGAITVTLQSDWRNGGNFVNGSFNGTLTGPYNFYLEGNFAPVGGMGVGTYTLHFVGTGTTSWAGSTGANIVINTTGTLVMTASTLGLASGKSLIYSAGTTNCTGGSMSFAGNVTADTKSTNTGSAISSVGINFNNLSTAGVVLLSDLTAIGNFTNGVGGSVLGGPSPYNIYIGGNIVMTGNLSAGNAIINMVGTGSWTGPGTLSNNLNINTSGTFTLSGSNLSYCNTTSAMTFTHISGTVLSSNSTIAFPGSCTLNTSGMTFNNVTISSEITTTLLSNWNIGGNLLRFGGSGGNATINGPFNVNISGDMNIGNGLGYNITGSASIVLNGTGSWYGGGSTTMNVTINTNGLVTFGKSGGVSGGLSTAFQQTPTSATTFTILTPQNVNAIPGNYLIINTNGTLTSLDLKGARIWGVRINSSANITLTLLSDIYCQNWEGLNIGSFFLNGFTVYIYGNLLSNTPGGVDYAGTTALVMLGDGMIGGDSGGYNNLTINSSGTILFNCTNSQGFRLNGGTFKYLNGNIKTNNNIMKIDNDVTLTGINNLPFSGVTIAAGKTVTTDSFFSGLPNAYSNIRSATVGSNYTITFNNNKEQIARFVNISDCNISQSGRLLVVTNKGNQGRNSGIRYINQEPNGFPSNENTHISNFGYGTRGWVGSY